MITYVNTVLVSNNDGTSGNVITTKNAYDEISVSDAGKFVVITVDEKAASGDSNYPVVTSSTAANYDRIKVGLITNKTAPKIDYTDGSTTYVPVIKWSNIISADSVKGLVEQKYAASTEDVVTLNFRSLDNNLLNVFNDGGKRIIVRLTFKDLPTRFRKWTESYEYVTKPGDTVNSIVINIVNMINKEYKRARVIASLGTASAGSNPGDPDTIAPTVAGSESGANTVILTAMQYDDDNSANSINWYNKVRFNANLYYTDPAGEGWESGNKHFPIGVQIEKTPGKTYQAHGKLVRDREATAMGYQGILNHGEGTWPIIQPDMQTDINGHYDSIVLEFERMYRTADDLQRRTKECLEVYIANKASNGAKALSDILNAFNGTTSAISW